MTRPSYDPHPAGGFSTQEWAYIDQNLGEITQTAMAKTLGCSTYMLRKYLKERASHDPAYHVFQAERRSWHYHKLTHRPIKSFQDAWREEHAAWVAQVQQERRERKQWRIF